MGSGFENREVNREVFVSYLIFKKYIYALVIAIIINVS